MFPLREKVSWAISPGHAFLPVLEGLSAPSCCCKSLLESYTLPLFFWACFLRLPSSWPIPVALRLFEAALPAMEARSCNLWVTRKVLFPRLLIPRCIPLFHPELDWNWSPRGACLHIEGWTSGFPWSCWPLCRQHLYCLLQQIRTVTCSVIHKVLSVACGGCITAEGA